MGDMAEGFKHLTCIRKQRRAANTKASTQILQKAGIEFHSNNNGIHLVVTGKDGLIDFWPSTGKFKTRNDKSGHGVFNLMRFCDVKEN